MNGPRRVYAVLSGWWLRKGETALGIFAMLTVGLGALTLSPTATRISQASLGGPCIHFI